MNRWSFGIAVTFGLLFASPRLGMAQVYYVQEVPVVQAVPVVQPVVVHRRSVIVPAPTVVTAVPVVPNGVVTSYYAPAVTSVYPPEPIAQMAYTSNAYVPAPTVVAAPVVVGRPTVVKETIRSNRHNYTQTVRVNGPTDGPRFSRVHVHTGLFGTTVRERVR